MESRLPVNTRLTTSALSEPGICFNSKDIPSVSGNISTEAFTAPERLTMSHLDNLHASGLSDATIAEMGCRSHRAVSISRLTGAQVKSDGYSIPYPNIFDQTGQPYQRFRLMGDEQGHQRYVSGIGDVPQLYIPPGFDALMDMEMLVVTEGEKKAAAAVQAGIPCVAIQGVASWAEPGPRAIQKVKGESLSEETEPLAELQRIAKLYKKVLVLGDSDAASKKAIKSHLEHLREALSRCNFRAALAFCPPLRQKEGDEFLIIKQGLDDWLKAGSAVKRYLSSLFVVGEVGSELVSDTANARQIQYLFGDKLARSFGDWLAWNGTYWERANDGRVSSIIVPLAEHYKVHRDNLCDLLHSIGEPSVAGKGSIGNIELGPWADFIRNGILKLGKMRQRIENRRGIDDALEIAKGFLCVPDDKWDCHPELICAKNCIVDLRSGTVKACEPCDRITQCTNVDYDPEAEAPGFLQFLEEVQPDPLMRSYLQRILGYTAMGRGNEQKFFIFQGTGANGKSLFLDLISQALGDYATKGSVSLLAERSPDKPNNDLAALRGRRLVSISEPPGNMRLNEAGIKAMTGCDRITARFLYCEYFSFRPEFVMILDTNALPMPTESTEAIWRRLTSNALRVSHSFRPLTSPPRSAHRPAEL